jgi:hypothetical protein
MNRRAFIAGGAAAATVIALPVASLPTLIEAAPIAQRTVFVSWMEFCRSIQRNLQARGFPGARVEDFSFVRRARDGKEVDIWGVRIFEPVTGARECLVWEAEDFCGASFPMKFDTAKWNADNVACMADGRMRILRREREAMFEWIPHYWGA